MKSLFGVLVLFVAAVVLLGFYRSWWSVGSDSTDNRHHLNITVDKDKIQEDKAGAMEKVQDPGHQLKDKVPAPTAASKDAPVPPVPSTQNQR